MFLFLLLIVLTGMFRAFLLFSLLLVIHEMGHFLMGHFLGWKLQKISFYPYGGCTTFETKVNVPLKEEFLVLIMGPLSQVLGYLLLTCCLNRASDITLLKSYHYGILFFNLLPIYPLDGGKLWSLLLAKVFPYQKSLIRTMQFSFFFLVLFLGFALIPLKGSLLMMGILLLFKLFLENKKVKSLTSKFLLERYLNDFSYKKRKVVSCKEEMFRDCKHIFKVGGTYWSEKSYLKKIFERK